jgi:hypothetical protein
MNKINKMILTVALMLLGITVSVHAEVDTTALDSIVSDCAAWITYGVTGFLTLVGAGLTIVGASWVYRKVKKGLNAA